MAAAPLFQLPDEAALAPVLRAFPGRERQIRSLATLLHVRLHPPPGPRRTRVLVLPLPVRC